jgi:hypothetical protein
MCTKEESFLWQQQDVVLTETPCGLTVTVHSSAAAHVRRLTCRLVVQPIVWLSKRWYSLHGSRAAQQRLQEAKALALWQQERIAAAAARMAAEEEARKGLVIVRVPCCLCYTTQHLFLTTPSLWWRA